MLKNKATSEGFQDIYDKYPKDMVARLIYDVYGEKLNCAVIVGLRTVEEYNYLRSKIPCKLIKIISSISICYMRNCQRMNREQFSTQDIFYRKRILSDNKLGLGELLKMSEQSICNEHLTKNEFLSESLKEISSYIDILPPTC